MRMLACALSCVCAIMLPYSVHGALNDSLADERAARHIVCCFGGGVYLFWFWYHFIKWSFTAPKELT